ncbi:hypothetical protein PV682_28300 [Streptomyces niveiscabiei]|uniref:hypothetical protein n=1 Tax=Streptomyces niveiscabiei TaxID=164115 RepID=UPI0029B31133|nr:hypothetical protein [Streptomyces niveiscabiei]MDX3385345.1 hypothetical protein [Streptomyces niveiscabiei]
MHGGKVRTRDLLPHLRALLSAELHAALTVPLLCGAALGLIICAVPLVFSLRLGLGAAATLLHLAAVIGGLGLAFVLDDPAAATTAVCPTPWWLRRSPRIAGALLGLAITWSIDVLLVRGALHPQMRPAFPRWELAAEPAALWLLVVALALLGVCFTQGQGGGVVGASGLLIVVLVLAFLPQDAAFFVDPADTRRWGNAVDRWRLMAVLSLLASLALLPTQPSARR